jgi:hypothetical protein
MDGLVVYDMFSTEADFAYGVGMILVSFLVFAAIIIYVKQRKRQRTQLQ